MFKPVQQSLLLSLCLTLFSCTPTPTAQQVETLVNGRDLKFTQSLRIAEQDEPRTGWQPDDLALAEDGRVWVLDGKHHRLLQVSSTGVVSLIAGQDQSGLKDGSAEKSRFNSPRSLFWTGQNLLIADSGNHIIRRLHLSPDAEHVETLSLSFDSNQAQSVQALERPVGAIEDREGNLYVSDAGLHKLLRFNTQGQEDARLDWPLDRLLNKLWLGPHQEIYFADNLGLWQWQADAQPGTEIKAIVSASEALSRLSGLGFYAGQLFYSDLYRHQIWRLDQNQAQVAIASNAPQNDEPTLSFPAALAFNHQGGVLADLQGARIRRLSFQQGQWQVSTLARSGTQGFGLRREGEDLSLPHGILYQPKTQEILVSDYYNQRLLRINAAGEATPFLNREQIETGPGLDLPAGLAQQGEGPLYISSSGSHRIFVYQQGQLKVLAGTGKTGFQDGQGSAASFNLPWGLTLDPAGNLYVADHGNHAIRKVTPAGEVTTLAGTGWPGYANGPARQAQFQHPVDLVRRPDGSLIISDSWNHQLRILSPQGQVSAYTSQTTAGTQEGNLKNAQFYLPSGLSLGPDGSLYVADSWNHRIRHISPNGQVSTLAGSGRLLNFNSGIREGSGAEALFQQPRALTVDPVTGRVFVADTGNHRVRVITP